MIIAARRVKKLCEQPYLRRLFDGNAARCAVSLERLRRTHGKAFRRKDARLRLCHEHQHAAAVFRYFDNQVKAKGTRPERRLLRALRLILIAIPQWVLLLRLSPQSIAKCVLSGCEAIASG